METARNGVDALDRICRNLPDVVTLDVNLPEMDGMNCLAQLMTENPLPVVMVSSLTEPDAPLVRQELVAKVRAASRARVRGSGGCGSGCAASASCMFVAGWAEAAGGALSGRHRPEKARYGQLVRIQSGRTARDGMPLGV